MQKKVWIKIFWILGILCLLFLILPVIYLFLRLSVEKFVQTLFDREVWNSIFISFYGAFFATLTGFVFGVPLAYILSRTNFKGKELIETFINIPVAIPHVAVGIALLSLFNPDTFLGKFFSFLHISFVDTIYGIIIAMLFVSISFVVSAGINGFNSVDRELEMVSRSLGASPGYTFLRITFPLAFPFILRGLVLAFARSLSEVGAILVIAYYPKTAPVLMLDRFQQYGLSSAQPVTAIVILVSLIVFSTLFYLSHKYVKSKT